MKNPVSTQGKYFVFGQMRDAHTLCQMKELTSEISHRVLNMIMSYFDFQLRDEANAHTFLHNRKESAEGTTKQTRESLPVFAKETRDTGSSEAIASAGVFRRPVLGRGI